MNHEPRQGQKTARRQAWPRWLPILSLVLLLAACGAGGGDETLRVEGAWARPAAAGTMQASMGGAEPMTGVSAVYMVVHNDGRQADRLLSAGSDVAQAVEIHETTMAGEVMSMRPVAGGLEIPAGGQVALEPGGYHVMLIGLLRELKPGDHIQLVLHFEHRGPLTVEAEVRSP